MLCEECKQRKATIDFGYGDQPKGARRWLICEVCLEKFAPGMAAEMKNPAMRSGWTSYCPIDIKKLPD